MIEHAGTLQTKPAICFDDLKVGQRVKVYGKRADHDAFEAREIRLAVSTKTLAEAAEIEGLIQDIDHEKNTLRLANREFVLPGGIEAKDSQPNIIGLEGLKAGDRVKLKGKYSERTGFVPERINIKKSKGFNLDKLAGNINKIDRQKKTFDMVGFTVWIDEKAAPSRIIDELEHYEHFLRHCQKNNFAVWDFRTFYYSDKEALPEKLIVLRHDIHHRDIIGGYKMLEMEKRILGTTSTCFVQLDFVPIDKRERARETRRAWQEDYSDFIQFCLNNDIDVQPHVSPFGMYFTGEEDFFKDGAEKNFDKLFCQNYQTKYVYDRDGHKIASDIEIIGEDVFLINPFFEALPKQLEIYNKNWKDKFGAEVMGYSAHGESRACQKFKYSANQILDHIKLVNSNVYKYTTNSCFVMRHLSYVSDTYIETDKLKYFHQLVEGNGKSPEMRFQVLVHPAKWYLEGR
jgi:hypothetical protein